ncbi:hypothetical protein NKG05_11870 [Oerskovia sp. M15]
MSGSSPAKVPRAPRTRISLRALGAPLVSGTTVRAASSSSSAGWSPERTRCSSQGSCRCSPTPDRYPTTVALAVVATVLAVTPPFLAPVRTVEILVVRTLLDVEVPVPRPRPVRPRAGARRHGSRSTCCSAFSWWPCCSSLCRSCSTSCSRRSGPNRRPGPSGCRGGRRIASRGSSWRCSCSSRSRTPCPRRVRCCVRRHRPCWVRTRVSGSPNSRRRPPG